MNYSQQHLKPTQHLRIAMIAILMVVKLKRSFRKKIKRVHIIKEWLEFAETNLSEILIINEVIRPKFIQSKKIKKQEGQVLFEDFFAIYNEEKIIRDELKVCVDACENRSFLKGRIMKMCQRFRVYESYFITNNERQYILLTTSQCFPKLLEKAVQQIQLNSFNGKVLTIHQYFQRPLFRTFQASLLLKELLKYTPTYHEDYQDIKQSEQFIENLTEKFNSIIKINKSLQKKLEMEYKIGQQLKQECMATIKAETLDEHVLIHAFQTFLIIQSSSSIKKNHQIVHLNRFSSCRKVKQMKFQKYVLLLMTEQYVNHFFFQSYNHMNKFLHIFNYSLMADIQFKNNTKNQWVTKIKQKNNQFNIFNVEIMTVLYNNQEFNEERTYLIRFELIDCIKWNESERKTSTISQFFASLNISYEDSDQKKLEGFMKLNQCIKITFKDILQINQEIHERFEDFQDSIFIKIHQKYHQKDRYEQEEIKKMEIQQYLNKIFRRKVIYNNPIWILKMLKISQILLNSVECLQIKSFHHQKCSICQDIEIPDMKAFYALRKIYLGKKYQNIHPKNIFCFNLCNLIRQQVIRMEEQALNTIYQKLTYFYFKKGNIDYAFSCKNTHTQKQYIKIHFIAIQSRYFEAQITPLTHVQEVIDEIGYFHGIQNMNDFRLVLRKLSSKDQIILQGGQSIIKICQENHISTKKCRNYQPKSFFSKIKSFAEVFQVIQKGLLYLKRIIRLPISTIQSKLGQLQQIRWHWLLHEITYMISKQMIIPIKEDIDILLPMLYINTIVENNQNISLNRVQFPKVINEDMFLQILPSYLEIDDQEHFMKKYQFKYQEIINKGITTQSIDRMNCQIIAIAEKYRSFFTFVKNINTIDPLPQGWNEIKEQNLTIAIWYKSLMIVSFYSGGNSFKKLYEVQIKKVKCYQSVGLLYVEFQDERLVFGGERLYEVVEIINIYQAINHKYTTNPTNSNNKI